MKSISRQFILKTIFGLVLLSLQTNAHTNNKISIDNTETFWSTDCNKTTGLATYDRFGILRKAAQVDAVGARIYKAEIINNSHVIISGVLYGALCEEKTAITGKQYYEWKNVSIQNNSTIKAHLSSVTGFLSSENFDLKIERGWYFNLSVEIDEFFSHKSLEKIKKGKSIGENEFHIVFKINYPEYLGIKANTIGANPFIIFNYVLKHNSDNQITLQKP